MEKVAFPDAVPSKENDRKSKHQIIPYLVATAAVSALVVVCVLGSLYIHELKAQVTKGNDDKSYNCETGSEKNTFEVEYEDNSGKVKEFITVDEERKNELIIQRNASGQLINVISADFNKDVMAVYSHGKATCFIVIGTQSFLPTWEEVKQAHENPDRGSPQVINLEVVSDTEIEDKSIMPDDVLGFCLDKPLYWAKPVTEDNAAVLTRRKRGRIHISGEVRGYKFSFTISW